MKRNIDFYIMLFICVLVCGVLYVLCDHTGEYSAPKSGNVFALRGAEYSANSHGSAANANSWTSVGGSGQTTATSRVRVSAPSSVRSHSQFQGSSYLPMISSPATNSASRVGHSAIGGNAKGAATVSGSAKTMPSQSVAYRGFSQPLAYGGRTNAMSSNAHRSLLELSSTSYVSANVGGDAVRQSVRQASTPSLVGASSSYTSVYAHNSRSLSVYGDYATVGEAMTSPYRANAQHRAPSSGLDDSWGNSVGDWLDGNSGENIGDLIDGVWWFDENDARTLYEKLFGENSDYWNEGMGNPPTEEDFLDWLKTNDNGGYRMPIGDVLPLVWMALIYIVVMFLRKRIKSVRS